MTLPIKQMLDDAARLQKLLDRGTETFVGPAAELIGDVCCHVQALACGVDQEHDALVKLRDHLMEDGGATCDIGTMMAIIEKALSNELA